MHLMTDLIKAYSAIAIGCAIGCAIGFLALGVHHSVVRLDQATRLQCATRDWPARQHQAHVEFCRTYLNP